MEQHIHAVPSSKRKFSLIVAQNVGMQQHQKNGILLLVAASLVSCFQITSTENAIRRQTRSNSNDGALNSKTFNVTNSSQKQQGNISHAERSMNSDLKVKGNIVKKGKNNVLNALGKAINRVLNPFARTTKKVKKKRRKKKKRSTTRRRNTGRALIAEQHWQDSETTPMNQGVTDASITGDKAENTPKQDEYLTEESPQYEEEYVNDDGASDSSDLIKGEEEKHERKRAK